MDAGQIKPLDPNTVNLWGQKFHACVALFYLGMGIFLGARLSERFPAAQGWMVLLGMLVLFIGAAWWMALWMRARKADVGEPQR